MKDLNYQIFSNYYYYHYYDYSTYSSVADDWSAQVKLQRVLTCLIPTGPVFNGHTANLHNQEVELSTYDGK